MDLPGGDEKFELMNHAMPNLRRLVFVFAIFAAAIVCAHAAEEDGGGSFLTPFPEGEIYSVTVVGDTFAEGLLAGLVNGFGSDSRLNIQKSVRNVDGVMSGEFEVKMRELDEGLALDKANVVIVMIGEDDRIPLKSSSGRKVAIMSPEWRQEYARRLDRMMKSVKVKNAGVYWVGLPILARNDAAAQAQGMNEVIRERANLNGFRYVDVYSGFADEAGLYSAYGPDLTGKVRVLRGGNGVHFTEAGNQKLAHFVEKELRRDLNQAKSERSIPLLGAEPEQAKINPDNAVKVPAPSSPAAVEGGPQAPAPKPVIPAAADPSGDQKADNGKIVLKVVGATGREEAQTIEIVRPAIPASVVSLMARRGGSSQMGDLLVNQIDGGLTLMSSVTPAGDKGPGKLSPSQAPYFRLLVKGERLAPKPGRADDVRWILQKPDTSSDAQKAATQPKG